uniref:Uncharacterized protein n=1 Tax=viral metagenome TaxID=1070528 RepID=A0A6H1ZTQ5_9ZZZZ
MEQQEVVNKIASIGNMCEAVQLLNAYTPKTILIEHIVHTLVEEMFIDIQEITDGFCVVN